jgi:hypothetical protein
MAHENATDSSLFRQPPNVMPGQFVPGRDIVQFFAFVPSEQSRGG